MAFVNLFDIFYPIGSLYFSFSSESPSKLFGGTWSQVTGNRYLRLGTTTNTGGAASVTHHHWTETGVRQDENAIYFNYNGIFNPPETVVKEGQRIMLKAAGVNYWNNNNHGLCNETGSYRINSTSNYTVSLTPLYQDVYCWRRTA